MSFERTALISDLHAPHYDPKAVNAVLGWLKKKRPWKRIVFLGDMADYYMLSKFIQNPKEKTTPLEETKMAIGLMKEFGNAANTKDITWIMGNHEDRFRKYLWRTAPALHDSITIPYPRGWKIVEAGKSVKVNDVNLCHGDYLGIGGGSINLARLAVLKKHSSVIFGHFHRVQTFFTRRDKEVLFGASIGCLCNLEAEYNPEADWQQGVGELLSDSNGTDIRTYLILRGRIY